MRTHQVANFAVVPFMFFRDSQLLAELGKAFTGFDIAREGN
jgi:hypothetical protein